MLTGGGSLLKHINLLAEYHTGLGARVGKPVEHLAHGYHIQLASPIYATAVGLLKNTIENMKDRQFVESVTKEADRLDFEVAETEVENVDNIEATNDEVPREKRGSKFFDRFYTLTKDFFEATPDSEF